MNYYKISLFALLMVATHGATFFLTVLHKNKQAEELQQEIRDLEKENEEFVEAAIAWKNAYEMCSDTRDAYKSLIEDCKQSLTDFSQKMRTKSVEKAEYMKQLHSEVDNLVTTIEKKCNDTTSQKNKSFISSCVEKATERFAVESMIAGATTATSFLIKRICE